MDFKVHPITEDHSRQLLLAELDWCPSDVWPQSLSPWDYKHVKWSRAKRQSILRESLVGKTPRSHAQDGKRVHTSSQPGKDKKLSSRKGFSFHSDIRGYIREYRETRKAITAGYKNCTCHGSYTIKDVKKVYESLSKLPKHKDGKRRRRGGKKETLGGSESEEDRRVVKDEGEDDGMTCDFPILVPSGFSQPSQLDQHLMQSMLREGNDISLESLVDRRLGRKFFGFEWQGSPCPVVSLTLPESHDVRRVFDNGTADNGQRRIFSETPFSTKSQNQRKVSSQSDDVISTSRGSSVLAVSPFEADESATTSPTLRSNTTTLSAKVRDFRPFSRNGLVTRVTKTIKDKRKRSTLPYVDGNGRSQEPNKHAVPWKILSYLGYNPSMRRYLHEIYTPAERRLSNSPLVISTKTCFKTRSRHPQVDNSGDLQKNKNKSKPSFSDTVGEKFEQTEVRRRHPFMEAQKKEKVQEYTCTCPEKHPKIAILPKFETVVKPKVSVRGLLVS